MKKILNISQELELFLRKKNVLTKFRNNTYNPKCNGRRDDNNTILSAFKWIDTPEGYEFWNDLNTEFNNP